MDTTDTLREIIRQDLDDVVFFGIYDPDAVHQAIEAGVGATVTLSIGAKLPMPQLPVASAPLTVTGVVQTISSGSFRLKGGLTPGLQVYMGRTVVLDTGKVQIVLLAGISSRPRRRCCKSWALIRRARNTSRSRAACTGAPTWARSRGRSWSAPGWAYARLTTGS